jgi:hypothetical protein
MNAPTNLGCGTLSTCRYRLAILCALLTAVLYGTSFLLPAKEMPPCAPITGWEAFVTVSQRPWDPQPLETREYLVLLIWWLPNPLLWVGIGYLTLGRPAGAAVTGLAALPAGLFCACDIDPWRFDFQEFLSGYYVWLASMGFLAGSGMLLSFRSFLAPVDGSPSARR